MLSWQWGTIGLRCNAACMRSYFHGRRRECDRCFHEQRTNEYTCGCHTQTPSNDWSTKKVPLYFTRWELSCSFSARNAIVLFLKRTLACRWNTIVTLRAKIDLRSTGSVHQFAKVVYAACKLHLSIGISLLHAVVLEGRRSDMISVNSCFRSIYIQWLIVSNRQTNDVIHLLIE